jgi:hypothetical protein
MLRIEKCANGPVTSLRLSGRIQLEHLGELQLQIESCTQKTILDLEEVKLVDRPVIRFLALCQSNGIELSNCPMYIREWILQEKRREGRASSHDQQ